MKAVLLPSLSYRIILKEIEGYKQAVHSCHTESRSVGWLNSKNTIDFPFQSLRKPGSRLTVTFKILTTAIHVSAQLQHKDEFGQHPTNLTSRLVSVKCKVVEWLKCRPYTFGLVFLLWDKTSAPDVFSSCSFIARAHFESNSVMVSFYGYEIGRHK